MLREADSGDVETIRRWRDHEKVRAASIWTDPITADLHARWWAAVQTDPARRVLIFESDEGPCGVVTLNDIDLAAGVAEWGFFLDVDGLEARGQLLQAWMELEREAIHYFFDVMDLRAVGGRTLAWNRPVLDLHRRFGFVEEPERGYTTMVADRPQRVVWMSLTKDRRGSASGTNQGAVVKPMSGQEIS